MFIIKFLLWCAFGLIVGGLARLFYPGEHRLGCVGTIALGMAGAVVGGFLWNVLLQGEGYHPGGFITATIGAMLVLFAAEKLSGPKPPVS